MVTPRDRLSVTVSGDEDWYLSPEGETFFGREIPEPAEPRTPAPRPKATKGRTVGFKAPRNTYTLVFDAPELAGLVIKARSASVRQGLHIQGLAAAVEDGNAEEKITRLLEKFVGFIAEWNLEDEEGEPVPVTVDSMLDQEFDFVMGVVTSWVQTVAGVPAPLDSESTTTLPPLEASLQMETLSPSLAS